MLAFALETHKKLDNCKLKLQGLLIYLNGTPPSDVTRQDIKKVEALLNTLNQHDKSSAVKNALVKASTLQYVRRDSEKFTKTLLDLRSLLKRILEK